MKQIWQKIGQAEIRNILAVVSVVGCFILLYIMTIKPIPVENKDTINQSIGFVFGGLLGGVTGFFFGASKQPTNKKEDEDSN